MDGRFRGLVRSGVSPLLVTDQEAVTYSRKAFPMRMTPNSWKMPPMVTTP